MSEDKEAIYQRPSADGTATRSPVPPQRAGCSIVGPRRLAGAHALLCVVISASMTTAAQDSTFAVPAALNSASDWICQADYDRARGWFMRCDNLADVFAFDAVLDSTPGEEQSRLIPLYGAPYPDSNLTLLASAVLCSDDPGCRITMASN